MKKVKILTITLIIAIIIMVGFFGIYKQEQNRMENIIPSYTYGMDLEGVRTIRLKLNQSNKTVIKDNQGKEVKDSDSLTDEQIAEKGYVKEEVPYNSDEVKNVENYRKSKEIIEDRLNKMEVEDYEIKLNEQTGEITIETIETDKIDKIIGVITAQGKFEITDSQTGEILIDNNDIKNVDYLLGQDSSSTNSATRAYINIEFNQLGKQKLTEMTKNTYKTIETNTTENTTTDNQTAEGNTTTDDQTTEQNKEEQKTIDLKIDGEIIETTSFDTPLETGIIQLATGTATTDLEKMQENLDNAKDKAIVFNTKNIPLVYEIAENQYVKTDIQNNDIKIIEYVSLGIIIIAMIFLIIKYKILGVFGAITYIGFVACFKPLLIVTNTVLSIEGFVAFAMILILDYILTNKLLKQSYKMNTYKEFFIKIIPLIIIAVVFSMIKWTAVESFGTVAVWGIILMAIYNIILTSNLIRLIKELKK